MFFALTKFFFNLTLPTQLCLCVSMNKPFSVSGCADDVHAHHPQPGPVQGALRLLGLLHGLQPDGPEGARQGVRDEQPGQGPPRRHMGRQGCGLRPHPGVYGLLQGKILIKGFFSLFAVLCS
jgi:hypothetical protein